MAEICKILKTNKNWHFRSETEQLRKITRTCNFFFLFATFSCYHKLQCDQLNNNLLDKGCYSKNLLQTSAAA